MKKQTHLFAVAMFLSGILAFGANGLAQQPPNGGGGVGGGGSGGGNGGHGEAPDFGDLIILYRNADGVPVPSASVLVEDPETGAMVDGGLCWQPIAFEPATCGSLAIPLDGPSNQYLVPVNQYSCGVETGYTGCTQEVDFGRFNAARSPDQVLESQLEDVVASLSTADQVTLDPAGRLIASTCNSSIDNLGKTIDSPLQNLAIYKQIILTGSIGGPLPQGKAIRDIAATGLGAASDKSGEVNIDLIAYLNQIMGLTDPQTTTILDPKLCETYRKEVQGVIQEVEKCFLNYGNFPSSTYNRRNNFETLPNPAYIDPNGGAGVAGMFEFLTLLNADDPVRPQFVKAYGQIFDTVFGENNELTNSKIRDFATAADDARAVISFMHEHQVPVDFETRVPCTPSGDSFYDLSISEESGLQVPKNYVNGGEREFFVNIVNLGPDLANGIVTVIATNGEELGNWEFLIDALPAGQTASFTQIFTIETSSNTINWTATVVAEPDVADPNPSNNSVYAVSNVRANGGDQELLSFIAPSRVPINSDQVLIVDIINNGPAESANGLVTVEGVSSRGDNVQFSDTFFDLQNGEQQSISFPWTTPSAPTTFRWTAIVTGNDGDTNQGNNGATAITRVRR